MTNLKCPHCGYSRRLELLDVKGTVGLFVCGRCRQFFEVVGPPKIIKWRQTQLLVISPKFTPKNRPSRPREVQRQLKGYVKIHQNSLKKNAS